MKMLDRYVIRSFLTSLLLLLAVMLTLRTVIDLFVNMDEFTESGGGVLVALRQMGSYYGYQMLAYVSQLGGVIVVAAAAFTIARMNHSNELTAIMASGVSLHRVLWPIVACSMLAGGVLFLDRELVIPRVADKLTRSRDGVLRAKKLSVPLMTDANNAVWYAPRLLAAEQLMQNPTVIIRDKQHHALGMISGTRGRPGELEGRSGWVITSDSPTGAVLSRLSGSRTWGNPPRTNRIWTSIGLDQVARASALRGGDEPIIVRDAADGLVIRAEGFSSRGGQDDRPVMVKPVFTFSTEDGQVLGSFLAESAELSQGSDGGQSWVLREGSLFVPSDLTVKSITLRRSSRWLDYMSISDLNRLLELRRVPDPMRAIQIKHVRIADPLNNIVMLLLGVPFILSRQRNVRASALWCLLIVGAFYAFTCLCRYIVLPWAWAPAWLPLLAFGPIAAVNIDSVKT